MKVCEIEGCDRKQEGPKYGLCKSHAQRLRKNGRWEDLYCHLCTKPLPITSRARVHPECRTCKATECEDIVLQHGYCARHFMKFYRHGPNWESLGRTCFDCGCSIDCQAVNKKFCAECARKRISLDRIRANNRRRTRAGVGEHYTIKMLLDMDGSACYLCSGELDDSPSIDHIVAIARGGQDAVSNVALTHWDCNNKKRAKSLDETARLFPQMVLPMRMRDLYAKA